MTDLAEPLAYFDLGAAPMRIGTVRLKVRDLGRIADFYRSALGLEAIETGAARVLLGAGGEGFFELLGDPALTPASRREAGLFHTAFLLPSRSALADWLGHVAANRIPLDGASNHRVSEAIYLADPEGNGIEVYADRPLREWRHADGTLHMTTEPLDFPDLMATASERGWAGMPQGSRIGHIHLQVGETGAAERFYQGLLGFDLMARYPGASFFGAGGYHHQIGANAWNSRGAGERPAGKAGLDRFEIVVRDRPAIEAIASRAEAADRKPAAIDGGILLRDPWGTEVALRAA